MTRTVFLLRYLRMSRREAFEAEDGVYTVKAMVWEKNGMKPLCDTVEKNGFIRRS